jgi:hypothetical protein
MAPRVRYLVQKDEYGISLVEIKTSVCVEVAYEYIVPAHGEDILNLIDTDGDPFKVGLKKCSMFQDLLLYLYIYESLYK